MNPSPPRRSKAGGAKKRPTRYAGNAASAALATALRLHKRGDHASARAAYDAAIAGEPGDVDAWMNKGALAVLAGRAAEAIAAFASASAFAPDNARAARDAGIGLAAIGELGGGRGALERAIALDSSLIGARLALCRVVAELGDEAAAIHHARCAVRDAPRDASAHVELHRALFDDRDLGPCLEAAARAVALDPGHALARLCLSGALAMSGDSRAAAAALGDDGLVASGLRDAIAYATAARPVASRCFSSTRQTLYFAMNQAQPSGLVLELGVRHGVTLRVLADASGDPSTVHGFDSFAGLPEPWQGRPAGAFSTGGELPDMPDGVALHAGWFDVTLPRFLAGTSQPLRLVHIDSDLYSSARTALLALGPRVRPGCVLVFDEYLGNASWRSDEHRAFHEAAADFGWRFEELSLSWLTGQGVVRIF